MVYYRLLETNFKKVKFSYLVWNSIFKEQNFEDGYDSLFFFVMLERNKWGSSSE